MASAREIAAQLDEVAEEVTPEDLESEKAEEVTLDEDDSALQLEGAEIPSLFASDAEPVEKTFRVKGAKRDSTITFMPMDADHMARYREAIVRNLLVEAEMICLESTITDLSIYFPNAQMGRDQKHPLPESQKLRRAFYERMLPQLRDLLYVECLRVNGLAKNP